MQPIEKTLEYHELLMTLDNIKAIELNTTLPSGYKFVFWSDEDDKKAWNDIHLSSGEFASIERGYMYFDMFYSKFFDKLNKRCFFIEHNGQKIATATISPCDEFGYPCVIDWLAISKEYQGNKLSKPLINKCLEVAKSLGYDKILLHTQTHTWLAAKLYLNFGFVPFNIDKNIKGWQILKTIINHEKLKGIQRIEYNNMFDNETIKIVELLKNKHVNFNYEIWNEKGFKDIYVNENNKFYHYYLLDGETELKIV